MDTIPFGRTGHRSSRVIFGAAALGSMRQKKADQLLELLLAHGINHIDLASDVARFAMEPLFVRGVSDAI